MYESISTLTQWRFVMRKRKTELLLVIGIPGSGKSTIAKKIKDAAERSMNGPINIRETDEYLVDPYTHEYHFDPSKLSEYHSECQKGVERDLEDGINVICSNTNLTKWERKPYFDIARRTNSYMSIIIMRNDYGNVHGVPREKLEQMKAKFQEVSSDEFEGIEVTFISEKDMLKYIQQ